MGTTESISDWIGRQRWYAGKGSAPQLRVQQELELASTDPDARLRVLLLLDENDARRPVYQVPVVLRTTIPRGTGPTYIGKADDDSYLFDAAYDPAFAPSLLAATEGTGAPVTSSKVLSGEQSNTSIVATRDDGSQLMIKVFRVIHHGQNPDVELQSVLSEAGVPFVPKFIGAVATEWEDAKGRRDTGHLAIIQEFISGARDGWDIALEAVAAGQRWDDPARELGRATAVMHRVLAEQLPAREASMGDTIGMAAVWHQRLAQAIDVVPRLALHRDAIEAAYDAARDAAWPPLQRIHGDLHLGQVLRGADRWTFIDFEGEPLRTLAERSLPEPALRDVAGMLRSFDYAGAYGKHAGSGGVSERWAKEWTESARGNFLIGYAGASGGDPLAHRTLLDAFELDKAVYEVIYEGRNRPDWVDIPLEAIDRLVGGGRVATS